MGGHENTLFAAAASQVAQQQGVDVSDDAIETVLRALTAGAVGAVPGARFACITLVDHGEVVTVASTDAVAGRIDELQGKHDVGPSLEAAREQHPVFVDDYADDARWPLLAEDVLAQTPVRSSASFCLHRDAGTSAALTLYADHPSAFDSATNELAITFAVQAASALHADARHTQFTQALTSRDEIGQAKGILMERYDIDATQAFAMLKKISQDTNTKIAELARRLVALDHPERDTYAEVTTAPG